MKKVYIVICEGTSEDKYIKEINKFFRENDISVTLYSVIVGNGSFSQVYKKFKEEKIKNKKGKFIIWVDDDIYQRNKNEKKQYDERKKFVPDFKFNKYNFEDMIVLHLSDDKIDQWNNICIQNNHFNTPMTSCKYLPLFCDNIIPEYEKGNFPPEEFDTNTISRAIKNNNNEKIKFHSDFLSFIEEILNDANFDISQETISNS